MKEFILLALAATAVVANDLPPSCKMKVFCDSNVLHYVQMARLYNDSKTFVDLQMRNDENTILNAFQVLLDQTNNNPSKSQLQNFVDEHFDSTSELEDWSPPDYNPNPEFVSIIRDEKLRQFGKDINDIWPDLGKKIRSIVFERPDLFSIIPVSHGFIIPGGRFRELYYWDAYWIIEGLLISGMNDTVEGMLENFIELHETIGHIPNGGRWYYQERSQPPLLTAMVLLYYQKTRDIKFLRENIEALEGELNYWLDTQIIAVEKDNRVCTVLRYYTPSSGPRPESYYEDYKDAQSFATEEEKTEFYIDIKSACESGWDFSSRWFIGRNGENTGNLTTIHTRDVIPVDLNAIFANALENVAYFHAELGNPRKASIWADRAKQWKSCIEAVLWNEEEGVWFDYDLEHSQHRKSFYPSNIAPLWMNAVDRELVKEHAPRVLNYLRESQGLDYPGGVPSSLIKSGEQWDFPNAWPPLVSIVVNALDALGSAEGSDLAFHVAQTWVRANYKGFTENKQMFEKYDVETPGAVGGGGEYTVQEGFGWSNGVVLEFLIKYASRITADDSNLILPKSSVSSGERTRSGKDINRILVVEHAD